MGNQKLRVSTIGLSPGSNVSQFQITMSDGDEGRESRKRKNFLIVEEAFDNYTSDLTNEIEALKEENVKLKLQLSKMSVEMQIRDQETDLLVNQVSDLNKMLEEKSGQVMQLALALYLKDDLVNKIANYCNYFRKR